METTEQRIARERVERQKASDTRSVIRQARTGARPTNSARREEAQSRFKELLSPTKVPQKATSPQQSGSSGSEEFYAWKDGQVGKIKILTEGGFTPSE